MDQKRERGNLDGWRRRSVGPSFGGPLWLVPFLVQGRRKGGKGRTRAEGNPKGEKEEGRRRPLFLVTISPSSSLAVNAPPRPSLPFGGNQSCGDHDKSVEDGGCAAQEKGKGRKGPHSSPPCASVNAALLARGAIQPSTGRNE